MDEGERGEEGVFESWKPCLNMILVQMFATGMIILSKVVIGKGMFVFSLLSYRSLFGALAILPLALFFERDGWRKLELKSLSWISLNAFIGYAVPMGLYYYGLSDTTPSYSVIFLNIIPIATYILAVIFRMENLGILSLPGSVKIAGTLLCFGGTLIVTLYKGRSLHLWPSIIPKDPTKSDPTLIGAHQLRGTIFLTGSSFSFACWYLLQARVLKVYPYKCWSSMMTCLIGGIQTGIVGIILRRDKEAWQLGWNLQLLTVLYSGILSTAAKYTMNSYAVEKRGPSYPPMFNALSVVFTIVADSLFMGDDITVGSLVGTILIIAGLYLFLWGRGRDQQRNENNEREIQKENDEREDQNKV